ncbi:MAG: LCP family protein [Clostridiales bacterium]|nr:LCP family protein [Clostridiales bacterium]
MANNKKHKKRSGLRVLLRVLVVIIILAAGAVAFLGYQLSKLGTFSTEELGSTDIETESITTSVEGVCNILLIGQDNRSDDDTGRSDTMIIFSINQNTNQMSMISLMRDTYVEIPGYSSQKLNAAYSLGGVSLLDETIAQNYGVNIDYNVAIDFEGFIDVIDTLGGVDIELNEEEVNYLQGGANGEYLKYLTDGPYDVTVGVNRLNGAAALDYARTRKVGQYDFERTQRQRNVITAVFNELKGQSITSLLAVYNSIAGDLTTDMTALQIAGVGLSAYGMKDNGILSYRLPTDDMYTNQSISGIGSVLIINDWDYARETLAGWLYDEPEDTSAAESETE